MDKEVKSPQCLFVVMCWCLFLRRIVYFSLRIDSASGSKGSVCLEHCSSVVADMILTFGSFHSDIAYTPGFGDPCIYSGNFGHLEWRRSCKKGVDLGEPTRGLEDVLRLICKDRF